jgi:predicted nucleic acid-binding protein
VILFFDTSALIKRYLHEKGAARVRRLLQTGGATFYQTFITPLEMTSAFYRQHRDGQVSIEELSLLLRSYAVHSHSEYLLVPYSEALADLAAALISRYPLRALDADRTD